MTCYKLKMYDFSKSGELKEYTVHGRYYLKYEVDALLAEKDAEITRLESACRAFATERDANQDAIYELRKEIESLKASHYAEMVDAGMRERRLKRALYKVCANWAWAEHVRYVDISDGSQGYKQVQERWEKMASKCIKKAREYR